MGRSRHSASARMHAREYVYYKHAHKHTHTGSWFILTFINTSFLIKSPPVSLPPSPFLPPSTSKPWTRGTRHAWHSSGARLLRHVLL